MKKITICLIFTYALLSSSVYAAASDEWETSDNSHTCKTHITNAYGTELYYCSLSDTPPYTIALTVSKFFSTKTIDYPYKTPKAYWNANHIMQGNWNSSRTAFEYSNGCSTNANSTLFIPDSVEYRGVRYHVTSTRYPILSTLSNVTTIRIPSTMKSLATLCGGINLNSILWDAVHCNDFSSSPLCWTIQYFDETSTRTTWTLDQRSQITSFTFGEKVEHIPAYLCNGLTSLHTLSIPKSVTSIGASAFFGCTGFTSIECQATTPPTLGDGAFGNVDKSIPVYIPCGTLSAYQSADGWSEFTNFIASMPYSCTVKCNYDQLGTAEVVTQAADCDGIVTIQATPTEGSVFVGWSDGNTDNPRTFAIASDTTLIAIFERNNNVNVYTQGSDAYFTHFVPYNGDYSFKILPNLGAEISSVTVNGVEKLTEIQNADNTLTLTGVTDETNVIVFVTDNTTPVASHYTTNSDIRVLPNVFGKEESFSIVGLPSEQAEITIYNSVGVQVYKTITQGQDKIKLKGNFAQDCYVVKVQTTSKWDALKFIVK